MARRYQRGGVLQHANCVTHHRRSTSLVTPPPQAKQATLAHHTALQDTIAPVYVLAAPALWRGRALDPPFLRSPMSLESLAAKLVRKVAHKVEGEGLNARSRRWARWHARRGRARAAHARARRTHPHLLLPRPRAAARRAQGCAPGRARRRRPGAALRAPRHADGPARARAAEGARSERGPAVGGRSGEAQRRHAAQLHVRARAPPRRSCWARCRARWCARAAPLPLAAQQTAQNARAGPAPS